MITGRGQIHQQDSESEGFVWIHQNKYTLLRLLFSLLKFVCWGFDYGRSRLSLLAWYAPQRNGLLVLDFVFLLWEKWIGLNLIKKPDRMMQRRHHRPSSGARLEVLRVIKGRRGQWRGRRDGGSQDLLLRVKDVIIWPGQLLQIVVLPDHQADDDDDEDSEDDQSPGDHADEGLHGHPGHQVDVSGLVSCLGVMVRTLGLRG